MTGCARTGTLVIDQLRADNMAKQPWLVSDMQKANDDKQEWLVLTPKNKMAKPEKVRNLTIMPKVVLT